MPKVQCDAITFPPKLNFLPPSPFEMDTRHKHTSSILSRRDYTAIESHTKTYRQSVSKSSESNQQPIYRRAYSDISSLDSPYRPTHDNHPREVKPSMLHRHRRRSDYPSPAHAIREARNTDSSRVSSIAYPVLHTNEIRLVRLLRKHLTAL